MSEPTTLSLSLLVKLGSVAVHVDEFLSADGHPFDRAALEQLLRDSEVAEWLAAMDKLALLPKKRSAPPEKPKKKRGT